MSEPAIEAFASRLNKLFEQSEAKVTNREVATRMRESGCAVSMPYLSQLRTGVRENPSIPVVNALANFFRVSPDYFYDASVGDDLPSSKEIDETMTADAAVLGKLLDDRLHRLLTMTLGLAPSSVELLVDVSGRLRLADRC
ncbi:helix-turn-helix domain-containing protein [Rhodococcus qingshengii]|uniref:Helix-turn-helix domain-containing protein n=1 Tax=Rhodococcus qingshengii TaxID=334542 RepID=A0AAW6LV00_RHOSG|nr:helix-turn-helix domain-containing protein [Rhodococcus qingshengii]MDE8649723.1 helix-turn-helix domain-containing protein [Rhodococcus qingshengii]